jgi:hypothetical protein
MSDRADVPATDRDSARPPEGVERRPRATEALLEGLPRLPPMAQAERDALLYDPETGLPWPGGKFCLTDITPALPLKPEPRG